ncbi:hypothetical protein ACFY1A_21035 [Streptomyces sp. NPDC001520]|uniref:hypothetical protein n=1 Tax=Streptomyces sp. NPDC001520 TaxID=3364581 RepID=UPI0036AAAA67
MTNISPAALLYQAAGHARLSPANGLHRTLAGLLDTAGAMAKEYPELAHDHDREACDDYACALMGATLAVARQILGEAVPDLTPQPPPQHGPMAHQTPHRPSNTPEGPATRDRAAQGRTGDRLTHRTVEYLLQTRQPDGTWEVSSSGTDTPGCAQQRLERHRERMPEFEHRIARRTFTVAIEPYPDTDPDSPADSPDNQQNSADTPPGHDPPTRADTVRTRQDTPPMDPVHILGIGATDEDEPNDSLREQYAETLDELYTRRDFDAEEFADAVLAVRDSEMEQLREAVRARDERHDRQVQLGIRVEERAEQAEEATRRILDQRQELAAERYAWQERALQAEAERDQLRATDCFLLNHTKRLPDAEAALARVRKLANDWATHCMHFQTGWLLAEINAALDGREAPARTGNGAPTEPHPAEAERDQAYAERAALLAWISALHPANAVITPASDIDEPGWSLLYLLVSGWQMSWHIHPRDAQLFAHVEHVPADDPRAQWDGHSTAQKYERIQENVNRLGEQRASTSTVRIEITPDPPHVADAIRDIRRFDGPPPRHP